METLHGTSNAVPVNGINGDEDCLSYSSTEQEASVHEGYMSHSAQLNFSVNSGKFTYEKRTEVVNGYILIVLWMNESDLALNIIV